jgi:Arc/MetJ-type ribon-helix-helix transcriptional regulator
MDETVTSRLKQKDLLSLDKLIEMGLFSNRSEAIRSIVSERINELIEEQLITPLQKELNRKPPLSEKEMVSIGKKLFPKTVSDAVAEGRKR